MPSSLTWIDHDAKARERSQRILALFQEKATRDELGLGGVRDAFADQLFPGTSTIQTRLRYMLFVPWIYKALEEQRVQPGEFARRADTAERDLIDALRISDDRESGVLGSQSGRLLKRLPSSVYWNGLGSWGIRVADLTQDQYHRGIEMVYRKRADQADRGRQRERSGDDREFQAVAGAMTWHPQLPSAPSDFPGKVNFRLSVEEASFLLDRIGRSHPRSLLAHLAMQCEPAQVDAAWHHPDFASFPPDHRELLEHAALFSGVMHAAALLYNIELARARSWQEKLDEHAAALERWVNQLDTDRLRGWSISRLWELTNDRGHAITPATRRFVEAWVARVRTVPQSLNDDADARELVRRREMALKRARSRFGNRRALDQWGGSSGLVPMTFRWPTAARFLRDLSAGLKSGNA